MLTIAQEKNRAFAYDDLQNGFQVRVANEPLTNVPGLLLKSGNLHPFDVCPQFSPPNPEHEERGMPRQNISEASLIFARTRSNVEQALRAIAAFVFRKFNLPTSGGLDIGSGATGAMIGQFLSPLIVRPGWTHSDINPAAVANIRSLYPGDNVVEGSYLHLRKMVDRHWSSDHKFDLITGLSSVDATHFPGIVVAEIRDSLREGGCFVHIQDVKPGHGYSLRRLKKDGYEPPYKARCLIDGRGAVMPLLFDTPGQGTRYSASFSGESVGDLFRYELGDAVRSVAGMDLRFNHWVTARRAIRGEISKLYYLNCFFTVSAAMLGQPQPAFEEASAVVTVAQKIVA